MRQVSLKDIVDGKVPWFVIVYFLIGVAFVLFGIVTIGNNILNHPDWTELQKWGIAMGAVFLVIMYKISNDLEKIKKILREKGDSK